MENPDRNTVYIAVSNSIAWAMLHRLTDFPSLGRNELRSPIRAKLRNTRNT